MSIASKAEKGIGRSSRGGIHSSRARRLSDKVNAKGGSGGSWLYAVAGVAGLGIAAGVVFSGSSAMTTDTVAVAPTIVAPMAEAPVVTAASDLRPVPDASAAASSARIEAVAPVVVPEEEPFVASRIPCVANVETRLRDLRGVYSKGEFVPWSRRQSDVSRLVQDVIDCESAALNVTGNLELLQMGLADLSIQWDRNARALSLTTMEPQQFEPGSVAAQNAVATATWTDFVIR